MIRYGLTACITHFTIYQQLNSRVISDLQSAQEIELHAQFAVHYLCARPLDPHQHTATRDPIPLASTGGAGANLIKIN